MSRDDEDLGVVEKHAETQAVFEAYEGRVGERISCNALFQTIEEVAANYSLDLDTPLEAISRVAAAE